MQDKYKYTMLGALVGTVVAVTLAAPAIIPKAWADEQPIRALQDVKHSVLEALDDKVTFYKPDWTVEDSVSTTPIRTATVRKIEAGKTSFVTIATTSTGVYSSDGLESPNIRYPGIHPNERKYEPIVAVLTSDGWVALKLVPADSFTDVWN